MNNGFVLTNVLRLRGFVRCIYKNNKKKETLDFYDKYGQYKSLRSYIRETFTQDYIDFYTDKNYDYSANEGM